MFSPPSPPPTPIHLAPSVSLTKTEKARSFESADNNAIYDLTHAFTKIFKLHAVCWTALCFFAVSSGDVHARAVLQVAVRLRRQTPCPKPLLLEGDRPVYHPKIPEIPESQESRMWTWRHFHRSVEERREGSLVDVWDEWIFGWVFGCDLDWMGVDFYVRGRIGRLWLGRWLDEIWIEWVHGWIILYVWTDSKIR